ncbi:hypothetical protein Y023_4821 [Burkholderia pseudomallei A79D]|nr:hypothetical protein Y023_4821 [Burkholderia pseudomallei A79D]KGX98021.1 hypothetical protein X997_4536 [Burkholderia pseudomallei A79C]
MRFAPLRRVRQGGPGRAGRRVLCFSASPPLCFSAFALPCLAAPFSLRCVTFLLRSVDPPHRLIASSPHRHVAVPHRAFEHAASSSLYARLFLQTISDAGRDDLSPLTGT